MKFKKFTYFAFMSLTGLLAAFSLADRKNPLPWLLVALCLTLALLFARWGAR